MSLPPFQSRCPCAPRALGDSTPVTAADFAIQGLVSRALKQQLLGYESGTATAMIIIVRGIIKTITITIIVSNYHYLLGIIVSGIIVIVICNNSIHKNDNITLLIEELIYHYQLLL